MNNELQLPHRLFAARWCKAWGLIECGKAFTMAGDSWFHESQY